MKHEQLNDPHYQAFVQNVVQTGSVFTLQDREDFFAECPSESYHNDWGEPETVYCFWGTAEAASACQQEEWADYQMVEISLADFMYETLIEMDSDQHLVGVAFDAELFGTEIEPIELLADLLDEIKRCSLENSFEEFEELQNYRVKWEEMVQQQQVIH